MDRSRTGSSLRMGLLVCPTLLLFLTTIVHARQRQLLSADDRPVRDALVRALGGEAFAEFDLALPASRPASFELELPFAGRLHRVLMQRHSLRARSARLRVDQGGGSYRDEQLSAPSTYRGTLGDRDPIQLLASLTDAGLIARLLDSRGGVWTLLPVRELLSRGPRSRHVLVVGMGPGPELGDCGAIEPAVDAAAGRSPGSSASASGPLNEASPGPYPCLKLCQIAFDADYEYYQARGGSVQNVVDRIDQHMNQVDFFYARDVKITYEITGYVVRTQPFYFPTSGGNLLDLFRAEWNTNQSHVVRDIAHLMTAKSTSIIQYGGLAWVGVVCHSSLGYGWSLDSAGIIGHEVGHNWNAGHCHDSTPCNNMCGACLYVAPVTKGIIESFRDSRNCLDVAPAYPTQVPPYAHPDRFTSSKDELIGPATLTLDVLANDHDGNCERVRIEGFDAVTQMGGTLARSIGSGPGGRDELLYTAPVDPFVGEDRFQYVAGDGRGGQASGDVTLTVRTESLLGYWKLDDASGTVAADETAGERDGVASGLPLWTTGMHAGALAFDGIDDSVQIPPLDLNRDSATITAWLRRDGSQAAMAGIVYCRAGQTVAGLHFGNNNELRYTWNAAGNTFNWNSGLKPTNQQWVFVALVIEPDRATIHLWDVLPQSAVNMVSHGIEEFDGPTELGFDPVSSSRRFRGDLDDVRFHDYALSGAEINQLVLDGGGAVAPRPADGDAIIDPDLGLSWVAGLEALSHDIFLGDSHAAVRDALPGSPEFQGNQLDTRFVPGALGPGPNHYWRVDELLAGDRIAGKVWQFRVGGGHRWRLDETSGFTAEDSYGDDDGVFIGLPILGQPGASASLGNSLTLDGVDDAVRFPPLDLDTDTMSITTWVRRDGPQAAFAGLVFSRSPATVAGLHLGNGNELRYTWNDDPATHGFDSGLVLPDGQWVFVALVIEPDRATFHLGQSGNLTTSVNLLAHGVEQWDGHGYIGEDPQGGRWFKGSIDDVRLFDAVLTGAEIETIYLNSQ